MSVLMSDILETFYAQFFFSSLASFATLLMFESIFSELDISASIVFVNSIFSDLIIFMSYSLNWLMAFSIYLASTKFSFLEW
jgi:hypothetical protein